MKRKVLAVILIVCLLSSMGCGKSKDTNVATKATNTAGELEEPLVSEEASEEAMVQNGAFSLPNEEPESWQIYCNGGSATFAIEDEQGVLTISSTGSVNYGVQLYQDIGELQQGCTYKLTFDISASAPRSIEYRVQINGGDYHAYAGKETYQVTKEVQTESLEFKMEEATDPAPRLVFNCGYFDDTADLGEHKIYLDNVKLELEDDSDAVQVEETEVVTKDVNIDQIGYLPEDKKIAVFRGEDIGEYFDVVDAMTDETAYTGKVEMQKENTTSGETDYYGDFSDLTKEGTYYVELEGSAAESYVFTIGNGIYDDCYEDVVNMLYKQRCGCDTDEKNAGSFAHKACHTEKATIYGTDEKIDVSGGWHDAGDYGRYVVSGAKTVEDLFLTVEQGEHALSDDLNIPESGNGTPDLLDEARYELEWMLKMQDSKSGGVYHKVTCANFPGDDVKPEDETEELIVCPISSTATYDFAAIMIQAGSLYADYDSDFAKLCKDAAKKAMDYAEKAGSDGGFKNPDGIATGEYADTETRDERYWASCEMYKATKSTEYLETLEAIVKNNMPSGFGWQSVGDYGSYAFLTTDGAKKSDYYQTIYDSFIGGANDLADSSENDGYFATLGSTYNWGSNMDIMNNAMHLMLANNINSNEEYQEAARNQLHYILGVNPMSISYVTGSGTLSPVNVHHRPSYALEQAMPGMLVGGPDMNLEDSYAAAVLKDVAPAKCYVDNHASYSTNEVTIYWNSPLIYVMSGLK